MANARQRADQALRALLGALVIWNLACGVAAVGWPDWLGRARGAEGAALHYIRVIGIFWIFVAMMESLGAADLRKYLLAGQLAVLLRLPTGLFHSILLLNALRGDGDPIVEMWFAVGDLSIFALGWWLLWRGGHGLLGRASLGREAGVSRGGF